MSDSAHIEPSVPPESPARLVHGDPSTMVGGIRSLLVQALEPRAMAAVADHGDFRNDFWGRIRRTSQFLTTVVFGSMRAAQEAGARVQAVHDRISGTDEFTGEAYSANDPELLLWVHNATLDSHLEAYRLYGNGLDREQSDRYVYDMRTLGQVVGLSEDAMPKELATLNSYMAEKARSLSASPYAKEGARLLLRPHLPLHIRPLWDIPSVAAYSSLAPSQRSMYGFAYCSMLDPGVRVVTKTLLAGLRFAMPPTSMAS